MKYVTVPVGDLEVVMDWADTPDDSVDEANYEKFRTALTNLKQALESPEPTETGELLPCPFCGDEAYRYDSRDGVRLAHCANGCKASLPVEDWNTRVSPKESVSREAREIIEHLLTGEFYMYGNTSAEREAYNRKTEDVRMRARAFLSQTQDRKEERPEGVPEFVYIMLNANGDAVFSGVAREPAIGWARYRFDGIVQPEKGSE